MVVIKFETGLTAGLFNRQRRNRRARKWTLRSKNLAVAPFTLIDCVLIGFWGDRASQNLAWRETDSEVGAMMATRET